MRRLMVVILLIVGVIGLLAGCDQSVQTTPVANAADEAIRYTPASITENNDKALTEFTLRAVDAKGDSRTIALLKRDYTDLGPGPYVPHIFAYGSGKLARFIPGPLQLPPPTIDDAHPWIIGSPSQVEVVDLNSGETARYQAPAQSDPYRSLSYFLTSFSPDGNQVIVPARDHYHLLNLNTNQLASIPQFDAFSVIGWSVANQLIYADVITGSVQASQDVVEQVSTQGQVVQLNLPNSGNNSYDDILSPDGKQLYYQTINSTQPPAVTDAFTHEPGMNVIERYDIASGSSVVVANVGAGDYFSVGSGNFTLSTDGRSLAYVESRPTATGAEQLGAAVIWRVDLTGSSAPVKVIGGLNSPFRLHWCNNSLYYYDGEVGWTGWHGLPIEGGKPTRIAGEILGCAP